MTYKPATHTTFAEIYTEELRRAVEEHPDEYAWAHQDTVIRGNLGDTTLPRKTVEEVAERMLAAVTENRFNHSGRAFKATCKRLGIPYTKKAILTAHNG